ncbi:tetratricopeptide repeat protein [Mesorhizobium sp. M2E.F.Ca.ET.209.01.1.1]|uniref:ATP-binding protein n=1 Tax=Mesorhizobium sp. M2E.F.Ca.ET.209.01.1.1 TaxID=2500526 RepID=UPI000FDAF28B|nr:winged helix-turn-helix domain-containing protein [Mesorhizobium sp. M2E.F.Ca.ET.209.01.1.1]TGS16849.1 tetratricopeptide repeat protein [Mesorhizobium sp. M2E.F.Ca.ET.209.01.1.1]
MAAPDASRIAPIRLFGPFRLSIFDRKLTVGSREIAIGSREFEILAALTETPQEVVSHKTLFDRVWPGLHTSESLLRVHVTGLRKILSAEDRTTYVLTVTGRGYRFAGAVETVEDDKPRWSSEPVLPAMPVRVIGRDAQIEELMEILFEHGFLTVAGPGGIGKTTVSLAIAHRVAGRFRDGVHFVDFTGHSEPNLVPSIVASATEGRPVAAHTAEQLAADLRSRNMLLILDSCEHLIEAIAQVAERLRASAPGVHILATSTEPLRAAGEWIYRLPPLGLPNKTPENEPEDMFTAPSVQLLIERAHASGNRVKFGMSDAAGLAEICQRVDGIPLAIEFAAARLELLGVEGVALQLKESLALLSTGRRTALPRHQTLSATLDWSYQLLHEEEQALLRALSIFRAPVTLEAVAAVAVDTAAVSPGLLDNLARLVAKSLLVVDGASAPLRYRLLETTRVYAFKQLMSCPDYATVAQRHARFLIGVFSKLGSPSGVEHDAVERQTAWTLMNDVRSALEWAFSEVGDQAVAVSLTKAAMPLWRHLMLSNASIDRLANVSADKRHDFQWALSDGGRSPARSSIGLYATLASRQLLAGEDAERLMAAWQNAFTITRDQTEDEREFWALWACWLQNYPAGEHLVALAYATRAHALVANSSYRLEAVCAEFFIAVSEFALGRFASVSRRLDRATQFDHLPMKPSVLISFQWNPFVAMRCYHADSQWHLANFDNALALVKVNFEIARGLNHPASLWCALAHGGCAIALRWGDIALAHTFSEALKEVSAHNPPWGAWGRCLHGWLTIRRGDVADGVSEMQQGLSELEPRAYGHRYPEFVGVLAEALSATGNEEEALETINHAINWAREYNALWHGAELLRIKGDIHFKQGNAEAANTDFAAALKIADEQGALAIRLRAATSLARMRVEQGNFAEARTLLEPMCTRFKGTSGAHDVRRAKAVLASTDPSAPPSAPTSL